MSRLGLWLVEHINMIIPPQPMHQELAAAKLSDDDYQKRDYEEAALVIPVFGSYWQIAGKRILDVGGGLGGKAAYCIEHGARQAISLDMRTYSNQAALRLRQLGALHPLTADAAFMPFADHSFDVILSVNAFEHIENVRATLQACKRILHPDGFIFLYFPPFYSPWGAHLDGWINFPWPHLFFSDRTLIEAARRVEIRLAHNANYIPPAQVDWSRVQQLPDLNRVTVSQFLTLIRDLELRIVMQRMLPFGWRYLSQQGWFARSLLIFLNCLARLPFLREVVTTKTVFVLAK